MSKSIFYSLLVSLLMFQSQSIGAANILGSGENVVNESDSLNDKEPINPVLDLPRDIKTNVKRHVNEPSSCSGISLDLSNMNIGSTVRNYFINGSYVQNLSMAHNNIEEFDNGAFDGLSNLKYLDLSYNKLSPTKILSFGGHATLETFILDGNKVDDSVNQPTESYYNHRGIYRQRTTTPSPPYHFISIPTSNIYPKLKNLSLRGINIIPSFDNWEQSFPSLEKLDLSDNNLENVISYTFFKSIPASVKILILQSTSLKRVVFDNLPNVEELDVSLNSFEIIGFLNCPNLKKLNLLETEIVNIPSDLNNYCQNIEELNMGGNRIENIDSSALRNLNKLKVLDLSRNPLKKIDFIGSLSQLNTLILNGMKNPNLIESLNNLIFTGFEPNLKCLSIKHNKLTNLPEKFIKSLTFLEEIDLSGNNLPSVPKLPTTLQTLNLQNNNINNLDDNLLRSLSNLKQIQLGNNPLKQIEIQLISNLPKSCILNWE